MFRFADYPAFRAAFIELRAREARDLLLQRALCLPTTFQRINAIADARKAYKRALHIKLPRSVWGGDDEPYVGSGGSSTKEGETYFHPAGLPRPTEVLAVLAAAGFLHHPDPLPLITLPSPQWRKREKYCLWCEEHKPTSQFSRDKRFSDGRHSYCDACRAELQRQRWQREA